MFFWACPPQQTEQGSSVVNAKRRSKSARRKGERKDRPADSPPATNRNLFALVVMGIVLVGAALIVRAYVVPAPRPSIVAKAVADASPEVAELLIEADDVARQMEDLYPGSVDTLDVTAMLHARFGDAEQAIASWQRCLEIDPDFAKAHFEIGLIAFERGENVEASKHFRRATEIDPASPSFPVHWAKSLTNEGKLAEAAEVLRADIARHPSSVASLTILGDAYLQLNQHEEAKRCYEQVVRLAPHVTSAYYGLGMACSKLGEKESAKQYLDRFKELKARDEQAHRDELKNKELGLSRVQESIAEVLIAAAKGFLAQNDPKTAEQLLIRARELAPALGESWRVLAWLYERQSRIDEAIETAREYAELPSEEVVARLNLGELLARVGRVDEAEQALREAVRLAPDQAEAQARLAEFYLQTKRNSTQAKEAANRAVDLAPVAHHFFLLALACQALGEVQPALAAIDRAISMAPSQPEYHNLRNTIRAGQVGK